MSRDDSITGYARNEACGSDRVGAGNAGMQETGAGQMLASKQGWVPDPLRAAMQLVEADKHHCSLQADQILMLRAVMPAVSSGLGTLASGIYQWCSHQGFWNVGEQGSLISYEQTKMKKAEKIALIHSEVSEMLEAVRNGDDQNEAEEAADIAIRLLDYCGRYGIDLGAAIEQKMLRNYQRPYKHGKGF